MLLSKSVEFFLLPTQTLAGEFSLESEPPKKECLSKKNLLYVDRIYCNGAKVYCAFIFSLIFKGISTNFPKKVRLSR